MPYNNTPISPSKEYTGTISMPLTRVKKIIHADEDTQKCSNNAAFGIAVATEMFIQYLSEKAYDFAKAEKKPRRHIQYRDVANAIARIDNLEFLVDVAPRTVTYKQFKNVETPKLSDTWPKAAMAAQNGDIPAPVPTENGVKRVPLDGAEPEPDQMDVDEPTQQLQEEANTSGAVNGDRRPLSWVFENGQAPYPGTESRG